MVDDLIILYDENETSFSSMGLGAISDAKKVIAYQARNAEYTLEMEYPITGSRYNDIKLKRIIYAKPDMYTSHQAFRIYKITKDLSGILKVEAEHISYDLNNYPVKSFDATGIADTFVKLKQNMLVENNFTFYTNKTEQTEFSVLYPTSCRGCLGGSEKSILNVFKGEYEFDNFVVKLWNERGQNRGVTINYGKNLTSYKDTSEVSSYSGVYPFYPYYIGEEEYLLELPEKIIEISGATSTRVLCLDMTDQFEELPTVAQLRSKANRYINEHNLNEDSFSYDLSIVPLENTEDYKDYVLLQTIKLCDTITVNVEPLGVQTTAKCTSIKYDCLKKKYIGINFGDIRPGISDSVASNSRQISDSPSNMDITKLRNNINNVEEESVERETLLNEFNSTISGGLGLYKLLGAESGQAQRYYFSDASTLPAANLIYKFDTGGFAYSKTTTTGGVTTTAWNNGNPNWIAGIDTNGNIVANTVTADYINALDIIAKRIQVKDSQNREIFLADSTDTGRACHIAGWIADGRKLYSERGSAATSLAGIYLTSANNTSESNWIKAINDDGDMFTVAKNGDVYCADIHCANINADSGSFRGNLNADGTGSIGSVTFNDGGQISATSLYLTNKLSANKVCVNNAELTYTSSGGTIENTVYFRVTGTSVKSSQASGSTILVKVGCFNDPTTGSLTECPVNNHTVSVAVYDRLDNGFVLNVNFDQGQTTSGASDTFAYFTLPISETEITSGGTASAYSPGSGSALKINSNFLPNSNSPLTLGSGTNKWNDIYAVNIHSNNAVDVTSDRNLKYDISYDISDYDDILGKLKPVVFKYKGQTVKHLGFIAQDVEETMNGREGIVDITNDVYGLYYSEFHALEVLEIQRLNKKIEELEEKINKLTNGGTK